jgi:hypothetical protein
MGMYDQIRSVAIMKKGVKVLFSTALMLVMMMSMAAAKPKDWVDPQYSFKGIHTVTIETMDLNKLVENDIDGQNMQTMFQSEAAKRVTHAKLVPQTELADVRITGQVQQYDISNSVIPAHYETRYHNETTTIKDKDGKETTITTQVPTTEYVPARTVYTSTVRLRLDVIDQKTGKAVFSRDDTRADGDSGDLQRTYSKLITAFYKEVDRKIRKG